MTERDPVEKHFAEALWELKTPPRQPFGISSERLDRDPVRPGSALTGERCLELFEAQLASRHLDLAARWLRSEGACFYTIFSAGHEGNAGVAAALRPTDPALLHYRPGASTAASYGAHQGRPLPVLFVCEDNGIGISVRPPPGWVRAACAARPGIEYFHADGSDLAEVYDPAAAAAVWVRDRRAPAFLHLSVRPPYGPAGSPGGPPHRTPQAIPPD